MLAKYAMTTASAAAIRGENSTAGTPTSTVSGSASPRARPLVERADHAVDGPTAPTRPALLADLRALVTDPPRLLS
ncbi:MAG TPA: hypothetical protein VEL73_06075 [Mycobacteriales bacterium]|nr:hypothetical protein [Mycobacteriales bacterium]